MTKKFSAIWLVAGCASLSAHGSDARSYVLMPVDTDLTEMRLASSETRTPGLYQEVVVENTTASIKQAHYFDLFGTLGAIQVTLPYTRLYRPGGGEYAAAGMSDSTLLFGWGVYNMPALAGDSYYRFERNGFSAAAAISVTIPSGKYKNTDSLNTGSNRYSQKLEIQTGWRNNYLLLEVIGGYTHYNKNDGYRGNNSLEQKNLYHAETHFSYTLIPSLWVSLDTFCVNGAEVVINNRSMVNSQRSFSGGVTAGYRLGADKLIKLIYQDTFSRSAVSTRLEGVALSFTQFF